jgi:hypothetical protein
MNYLHRQEENLDHVSIISLSWQNKVFYLLLK